MDRQSSNLPCPYCGRPLRWVPFRWFTRGSYQCDTCGDFPDLSGAPAHPPSPEDRTRFLHQLPRIEGDRPRVLLVDDSKEHRDLYALMLETSATVLTAAHGADALRIARSTPLDVVVVDVLMPGMDGWEVCAGIKTYPATRAIPVIILTSLDTATSMEPARRAGAEAVLMKPCPIERLAGAIESVIAAHRMQRVAAANRRWTRKQVMTTIPVSVNDRTGQVLNVSYGGLCLRVEGECGGMPPSFDVRFLDSDTRVQADVVWTNRDERACVCGAEVQLADDAWRTLVDAMV